MRCILFVDDQPNILEGLRHRLHRRRHEWRMLFMESAEAAIDALAHEPVDVVVTDLRMPRMDGATLLQHVHEHHPRVVRIALSGHAELETALRAANVAHQFLAKPCDAAVIEDVVDRACRLQALIADERIQQVVGRVEHLPTPPRVYSALKAALSSDNVSASRIAHILKSDVAISAKTLQLVNSAFFRLSRSIVEIEEAVVYLGFSTIQQVALAVEVFQRTKGTSLVAGHSLDALQQHALVVGEVASELFGDRKVREDAYVAGLLHDIGKLVLFTELPGYAADVTRRCGEAACLPHEAEAALWGVTHAEIGGYLLGLWGLPYPLIEAVANHHAPSRVGSLELGMLAATHIANGLVHDQAHADADTRSVMLDLEYVEALGVSAQLDTWRTMAGQVTRSHGAVHD
jgi:HD-like signal output (HDOD) protein